jgi:hypothetical protein
LFKKEGARNNNRRVREGRLFQSRGASACAEGSMGKLFVRIGALLSCTLLRRQDIKRKDPLILQGSLLKNGSVA